MRSAERSRWTVTDFVQGREQDCHTSDKIKEALLEQGCGDIELPQLTDDEILEKLKKRIRLEFDFLQQS